MSINIHLGRTMKCIATATTQLLNPELLKVLAEIHVQYIYDRYFKCKIEFFKLYFIAVMKNIFQLL